MSANKSKEMKRSWFCIFFCCWDGKNVVPGRFEVMRLAARNIYMETKEKVEPKGLEFWLFSCWFLFCRYAIQLMFFF